MSKYRLCSFGAWLICPFEGDYAVSATPGCRDLWRCSSDDGDLHHRAACRPTEERGHEAALPLVQGWGELDGQVEFTQQTFLIYCGDLIPGFLACGDCVLDGALSAIQELLSFRAKSFGHNVRSCLRRERGGVSQSTDALES